MLGSQWGLVRSRTLALIARVPAPAPPSFSGRSTCLSSPKSGFHAGGAGHAFLTENWKRAGGLCRQTLHMHSRASSEKVIPGDHMANAQVGVLPSGVDSMVLESFTLESGKVMKNLVVAYSTYGELNFAGDNCVVVGHSLTSNSKVCEWWGVMMGEGSDFSLNLQADFVVCCNYCGSPYGSASPVTQDPAKALQFGSTLYGSDFPAFTIRDQVRVQKAVVDALGVRRVRLAIGASMGGMVALEWAACFPDFVDELVVIAACGRHTDWAIGIGEVQRKIITSDENFKGGRYHDDDTAPEQGLAAARMMAMLSYRAPVSVDEKFARMTVDDSGTEEQRPMFQVESYLRYQGSKFNKRFDANCYLRLTDCLDTHNVAKERGEYLQVLSSIQHRSLVVGIDSDMLYPLALQKELAKYLPNASMHEIHSPHGHDSFLIEIHSLNETVARFRQGVNTSAALDQAEALIAGAATIEEREALLTVALADSVEKQDAFEKEIVRLNLRLQAMESKLQKVKEAALEGGEECVVAISSVDNNSIDEVDPKRRIDNLRDMDARVMRLIRKAKTPWGMSRDAHMSQDELDDVPRYTKPQDMPVVYGKLNQTKDGNRGGWA
eukprot:CAMPEP_0114241758 /NCGR_PEP_ID=MMETSP0058-20121206/9801_1 /TAXON_ID=36894 /ORGANISM="Pyramimonas parkeae, CCMP726" /LENGTH=606 /DNA_ID=CAMNT_0001354301 /DNA_START=126 /DNA_END=1947 /DNA_ORIENTATION=+